MEELKEKKGHSIERKILLLSLGGAFVSFVCIFCVFLFTVYSTEEKLSVWFPFLKDNLSQEITEHTGQSKKRVYVNHVISDGVTLDLNVRKCMDDVELIALTMTNYMTHPENYHKNNDLTYSKTAESEGQVATRFSYGINPNDKTVREDLALANNIKDLLSSISAQYADLPIVFYVISKNGYCLSINSDDLSYSGNHFSFLAPDKTRRYFDYRGLPAYTLQQNSDGSGRISNVYVNNNEPVVCYSMPYYDRDGLGGVVAFDVSIHDLAEFSLHGEGDHEWKMFFMDGTGKIQMSDFSEGVFSVKADLTLKQIASADIKDLVDRVLAGETGISHISIDGNSYYVSFTPSPNLKGHLAAVYFEDEIKETLATAKENIFKIINDKNNTVFALIKQYRLFMCALMAGLLLLSLIIAFKVVKNYTRPIKLISSEIESLSTGDLDKKISVRSGDEIETLAENINNMVAEIKRKMESISRVSSEKERIEATMNVAKSIQSNMLPKNFDVSAHHSNFNLFAMNLPAKSVSGDFYDLFMIDDDRLIITIADVSGKGIPAALFMVTSMTILRNLSYMMLKDNNDLANVVTQANIQLCDNNKEGMFVTVFTAVINLKTREISYVSGGHNPPLLLSRKKGAFEFLNPPKIFPMLGVSEIIEYEQNNMVLDDGDCLLLYTDGVTEAIDVHEKLFGETRLLKIMNEEMKKARPEAIVKGIYSKILDFAGEAEQFDDITMLCFRFK
jgi:sigma-B regulation protein RsbU (phosphoserine phosphatase)